MPGIVELAYLDASTGQPSSVRGLGGGGYVIDIGYPGVGVEAEISNQTSTPTQEDFASGLIDVVIGYWPVTLPAGSRIYVVFDALSDADALTKLATAGSRSVIMIGQQFGWSFSPSSPCYRIDIASDVATESGTTLVTINGKAQA